MMFVIGVLAFAVCILVSVALHECGHMWMARATGMKVRRYFVGFGPTLWSTRRPNRLGSTEYGLKAVPLGGFCDIAGMTSIDEIDPADLPYAMYRQKVWKRVAVLFAGPAMNFVVGLILIYGIAMAFGLPSLHPPAAVIGQTACVAPQVTHTGNDPFGPCPHPGAGPAAAAGLKSGDTVTKVGDTPVTTFEDMAAAIRKLDGPVQVTYRRGGQTSTTTVNVEQTQRFTSKDSATAANVGAIGVTAAEAPGLTRYSPVSAVPATFRFTGDLSVALAKSLAKIPSKFGALVHSIAGGERDKETPISVVGASIIGGDAVDHGMWVLFWFFLAQLNFVLGAVNLIPLLPLDGGHIAVATFEKLRNMIRAARGKVAAAPVNYIKLMPATYLVLAVMGVYMLLTVTADLVNPIKIFQ
ncbi:M50 family metallopeptidase [Mycobacterium sp. OTB74]|jgi:membrane-associated protease RseP (regulator of RpoE activity)|uniref:M50 family metallopeptidase n=1 Tax=Mycobacterium sp. OTB74 TaxID=1853452 RepID=UPI002476A838|nr:M50 family metallopeptidase [Mycobacterium sp. OTB74]MDH6244976.1 membrane-associated protease RseP (regulator of RpoE activity) [Mycobacterium sp. OTB74]